MSRTFTVLTVLALALILCVAGPAIAAETAKGKIKSVDADKNTFVVTDKDGKDWTFTMDAAAKIQLNNKESKINDLKAGDEVEVTYDKDGDKLVCKEVKAKRGD